MADEVVMGSFGDRVERAIERHADTVGEIRRGEREKPRPLRRNVVWLVVTAVSLYLVFAVLLASTIMVPYPVLIGMTISRSVSLFNADNQATS